MGLPVTLGFLFFDAMGVMMFIASHSLLDHRAAHGVVSR